MRLPPCASPARTMCSGSKKFTSAPPSLPPCGDSKDAAAAEAAALLLELAASDDLAAFLRAVEDGALPLDASAPWYGRSFAAGRRMALEQRTPLMISALYGSTDVVNYILSARPGEAARRSASDGATALHLAASGGSPASADVVSLLLDASADVDALDAAGNRAGDVISRRFSTSAAKSLQFLLRAPSLSSSPKKPPSFPCKEEAKPSEKKEYPPDVTLPDIKSGIYSTDEFRMYTFKVKPCSRAYTHDWTECPFVHPGENARRRDPRKYVYTCVPCPEFRKGSCRKGDACEFAHGVFESWLHPAQYRTRLCKDEVGCKRRICFFAHKPEELRSVNPSAVSVASGMVLGSPRSSSSSSSSLDMAAALMMMQQPGSPMSPLASLMSSPVKPSSLLLPGSRLKTAALGARDLDLELELLGLEQYQQKLFDKVSNAPSPRGTWAPSTIASPRTPARAPEYSELLGSIDASVLSQLQALQSPCETQMHPSQLYSGYEGNLSSSAFGLDHSMAKAFMNSRASAFAKRSQSFCDRGAPPASRQSTLSSMTTASMLSDWASPDGKLDWGVQGDELHKLRKSASFGIRSTQSPALPAPPAMGEPDLAWAHSLAGDRQAGPFSQVGLPVPKMGHQMQGGGELFGSEMSSPWAEQLYYAEQEQMVA